MHSKLLDEVGIYIQSIDRNFPFAYNYIFWKPTYYLLEALLVSHLHPGMTCSQRVIVLFTTICIINISLARKIQCRKSILLLLCRIMKSQGNFCRLRKCFQILEISPIWLNQIHRTTTLNTRLVSKQRVGLIKLTRWLIMV